ncbi:MAG TPA: hypothetical protein VM305_08355 [Candidatus Limnocylindrales bacterium]|nr:hypothetical protein [Candidatus Limnocylindrales bacterium]
MPTATTPSQQRTAGGLRQPAMVTVPEREWDEARVESAALRREALRLCDVLEWRLRALEPATYEIGPAAHQLAAGALTAVLAYRVRNER